MRTRAQAAADRKELWRQITREHRREARERLRRLREEIRAARLERRGALRAAKERCKSERRLAKERAKELRRRLLEQMRAAVRAERQGARSACDARLEEARSIAGKVARARAELVAERDYQRELRRIAAASRARKKELAGASPKERRGESEDEVRQNIAPDLLALWERVKGSIRGSGRMSRTEAFLKYAEEHPGEVLVALEDRSEAVIRELEEQQRQARRDLRRRPPRPTSAPPTALEDPIPF